MNEDLFNDFIQAQNAVYSQVIAELTQGNKQTHWMWFIFPQIKGLGRSIMSRRFAIGGLEQAQAYLQHDILSARLVQCAELLQLHPDQSALEIFGSTDALKLHSSLTLFTIASPSKKNCVFDQLLNQFFDGAYNIKTIGMMMQLSDWKQKLSKEI